MATALLPPLLESTVEAPTPARMKGVTTPCAMAPGAMLKRRWMRSALMSTLAPALLSEVGIINASPSMTNIGFSITPTRRPNVGDTELEIVGEPVVAAGDPQLDLHALARLLVVVLAVLRHCARRGKGQQGADHQCQDDARSPPKNLCHGRRL